MSKGVAVALRQIGLMLIAALGLVASMVNENLFLLAWISLVPFLFSLEGASLKRAYCLGALFGCVFFAVASFWLIGFLQQMSELKLAYCILLASLYWVYCAQLFALSACLVSLCARWRPGSEWFSLALLGTSLFFVVPVVFPMDLSITQGKFLLALQAIDITGTAGLHFLVLLHNGLVFSWIKKPSAGFDRYQYAALGLLVVWFIYGYVAYGYWSAEEKKWPAIQLGIVQPHAFPSIEIPPPPANFSRAYPLEMELSLALASEGAELVIWPEARYTGFYNEAHVRDAFNHYVTSKGIALLIQDLQTQGNETFNTSALISSQGLQEYRKSIRIPFGEYLPLADVPILGHGIKQLFGDFYTPVAQGQPGPPMMFKQLTMQPLICYEVAYPHYVASLIRAASHPAQTAATQNTGVQLLVTQSNDSWFGTSIEPHLHLVISRLRSLEQRLPLVHALNNGPSSVFSASGKITAVLPAYTRSAAVATVTYPEQPSLTWFSRFPYSFIFLVLTLTLVWMLVPLSKRVYKSPISSSS